MRVFVIVKSPDICRICRHYKTRWWICRQDITMYVCKYIIWACSIFGLCICWVSEFGYLRLKSRVLLISAVAPICVHVKTVECIWMLLCTSSMLHIFADLIISTNKVLLLRHLVSQQAILLRARVIFRAVEWFFKLRDYLNLTNILCWR